MLNGLNEGGKDLSWQKWSYKIRLAGEELKLHSISGSSTVEWVEGREKKIGHSFAKHKILRNMYKGDNGQTINYTKVPFRELIILE
ncbi:hypothetical protein GIB67_011505, partial [Kingdonia uniflora]